MKIAFFYVKQPDNLYKYSLLLRKENKCLAITKWHPIDAIETGKDEINRPVCPNTITYAVKEFKLFGRFHQYVYQLLRQLNHILIFEIIEPNCGGLIDHKWCKRALALTWEKIEIENLMSWLSTLGGAFSALGDSFEKCAERAARISIYQLNLAMKSGDPSVIVRCKLYYSISLIQKGKLRAAKHLILKQYEYAKAEHKAGDNLLYKMCHGIWLKLQYTHAVRKQNRMLKALSDAGDGDGGVDKQRNKADRNGAIA